MKIIKTLARKLLRRSTLPLKTGTSLQPKVCSAMCCFCCQETWTKQRCLSTATLSHFIQTPFSYAKQNIFMVFCSDLWKSQRKKRGKKAPLCFYHKIEFTFLSLTAVLMWSCCIVLAKKLFALDSDCYVYNLLNTRK